MAPAVRICGNSRTSSPFWEGAGRLQEESCSVASPQLVASSPSPVASLVPSSLRVSAPWLPWLLWLPCLLSSVSHAHAHGHGPSRVHVPAQILFSRVVSPARQNYSHGE